MKFHCCGALLLGGPVLLCCTAFASQLPSEVIAECVSINAVLSKQIAKGRLNEAQAGVLGALDNGASRLEPVCVGLLLNKLSAGLQMSGRFDEARTFAERAITEYQKVLPANDRAYLAPLHTLATVDLEQGLTRRAREVLLRMQSVHVREARDRLLVIYIGASLFLREGRRQEAESQFLDALSLLTETGRRASADASTIRAQLGYLYVQEQRYKDAVVILGTALLMLGHATDATPLSRIKLLDLRAFVWARLNRWQDAESDLAEAVMLCGEQQRMDSAQHQTILSNYAYVLRKMHRKQQARSVERLASAIQTENPASPQVVDLAELAASHR